MTTLLRSIIRAGVHTVIRRLPLKVTVAAGLVALALLVSVSGARAATRATGSAVSVTQNADTYLALASEAYDDDNAHDNATNNSRVTAWANARYAVCGEVSWAANTGGLRRLQIVKNRTSGVALDGRMAVTASGWTTEQTACTQIELTAGDYLELQVRHGASAALNATGALSLHKIVETAGGGSVAWADVTGKPDFGALYCDADGTEADSDCAGGAPDLSDYYTAEEVDGIAALASDTCGGPSLPPCEIEYAEGGRTEERADLGWWGVWAIVGLLFALMLAPRWFAAFRVTQGG